jgi:hypothetical protein
MSQAQPNDLYLTVKLLATMAQGTAASRSSLVVTKIRRDLGLYDYELPVL